MTNRRSSLLRRCTDKLFGGVHMSWLFVVIFAAATAAVTAAFLIFPVFLGTSFQRMGELFEAWILFAVFIMANCKTPLDSAAKTFVFFLISQPLIYLFQVPFSPMGWGLFGYYMTWFFWTLLTFPLAYVGWYIRRKNWLSLLILLPVIVYLTWVYVDCFGFALRHFPLRIVAAAFSLLQVALYLYVFVPKWWQRLIGLLAPLAVILVFLLVRPQVELSTMVFLPDDPVLTETAFAASDDPQAADVSVAGTGKDSMILIKAKKYGTTTFSITDGETVYRYSLEIYEDNDGHPQTRITAVPTAD